jgi:hypothetical protein
LQAFNDFKAEIDEGKPSESRMGSESLEDRENATASTGAAVAASHPWTTSIELE